MTQEDKANTTTSTTSTTTTTTGQTAEEKLSNLRVTESNQAPQKEGGDSGIPGIKFVAYKNESHLEAVMRLVGKDLSEPYSIFTYRYFLIRFPELCILAVPDEEGGDCDGEPVGCVVCKIDTEGGDGITAVPTSVAAVDGSNDNAQGNNAQQDTIATDNKSGYMAMLAVDTTRRGSGIGTALAKRAIRKMRDMGCTSVTLETEVTNAAAIRLYEDRLGFVREELLVRYYLNWGDAYRLRLWFD